MPVINCRVPTAAPRATMQATASGEYREHNAPNGTYTQVNMVRTIENILGMHPMNQKDSAGQR